MPKWYPTANTLPPEGVPVLARWPEGAIYHATVRITPEAVIWEVEGEVEGLPVAWRVAEPEAPSLMKKNLAVAWWMPAMAILAGGMIFLAVPLLGLIIAAAILAMWLGYAVLQSAGEAIAARHGVVLGAVVAMTPTLLALIVGLFFIIRTLR